MTPTTKRQHGSRAMLQLPDLPAKSRERLLSEVGWGVPRVIRASIEDTRRSIEELHPSPLRYWLRNLAWRIALDPEQTREHYEVAREAAGLVVSLKAQSPTSLRTLGAIHYRLGHDAEAIDLLGRSDVLHQEGYPGGVPNDIAFLSMAQQRAGNAEEASTTLGRLRELMKSRQHSRDSENRQISAEAEEFFEKSKPGSGLRAK